MFPRCQRTRWWCPYRSWGAYDFQELLLAGAELRRAISGAGTAAGRSVTHLLAAYIGGVNAITPIAPAAELGLPLVNGDLMGRRSQSCR
ncbi:DUF917 family protein [Streptomyces sp. NPDC048191]|uniref:S-methyl thiohydantoin desulfurase domain-containing protein n=1 Tax=Streptomyces sp. NPDC048191 TaxID=3155484 RepID=UPI0033CC2A00